ncbi:P22AR C-terminal domain-containing protein [Actinobacillus seminis]
MNLLLGDLIEPFEKIGSCYSATVYGHHHEYKSHCYDKNKPLK